MISATRAMVLVGLLVSKRCPWGAGLCADGTSVPMGVVMAKRCELQEGAVFIAIMMSVFSGFVMGMAVAAALLEKLMNCGD